MIVQILEKGMPLVHFFGTPKVLARYTISSAEHAAKLPGIARGTPRKEWRDLGAQGRGLLVPHSLSSMSSGSACWGIGSPW